ncbi:MAG: asparagine synthase (glutamine-hydrolyzing) [Alphaproteobacteria bacterium]|nr:asparagine synthase (glutamine-hydrolyzing) [Alphaproteobacteria bacterium]
MCGISGFLLADSLLPQRAAEARLGVMIATLRHRGPDDLGVWTDGSAGLAHARLSIIDTTAAGHQPMGCADASVWITYNGEVYNFAELRKELTALGYPFRSRSDTEVIVNGWHAWGPKVLSRLRGMFALAVWDRRARRLTLARDRLGKKPLYYSASRNELLFGSEIKALLAWPEMCRTPDLGAIDRYLSLGYVPAPDTAFAGIRKLPAAHYLSVETRSDGCLREPELVRYWSLPEIGGSRRPVPVEELQRELVARLEEAVRLRLVSDVPLGAFLSGGIDSSAVVAMMTRVGGGPVKTFSIGFSEQGYDETRYARMVAERYATDHREMVVEPDAVAVLPRLVWHYGEPFADPSAIPSYYLAELARREVTVALNGDGGDECFFGYPRYKAMRSLSRLEAAPEWSRNALEALLGLAPPRAQRQLRLPRIRALLQAASENPGRGYAAALGWFTEQDKEGCYGEAMREQLRWADRDFLEPYFAEASGLAAGANRSDFHTYLPDDLLVKVDVASMAHGLETRSPLLDHLFVEWAAGLPERLKLTRGISKALFKSAMAPYLPPDVVYRPKMGFSCPIDQWLRNELKELAYDTLVSHSASGRGLFRPARIRRLLDEHCSMRRDHHQQLWALLMLELWFEMWIDMPAAPPIRRTAAVAETGSKRGAADR